MQRSSNDEEKAKLFQPSFFLFLFLLFLLFFFFLLFPDLSRSFGIVDGDRVYQIVVGAPDAPQAAIRMQEVLRSFQLNMASK